MMLKISFWHWIIQLFLPFCLSHWIVQWQYSAIAKKEPIIGTQSFHQFWKISLRKSLIYFIKYFSMSKTKRFHFFSSSLCVKNDVKIWNSTLLNFFSPNKLSISFPLLSSINFTMRSLFIMRNSWSNEIKKILYLRKYRIRWYGHETISRQFSKVICRHISNIKLYYLISCY